MYIQRSTGRTTTTMATTVPIVISTFGKVYQSTAIHTCKTLPFFVCYAKNKSHRRMFSLIELHFCEYIATVPFCCYKMQYFFLLHRFYTQKQQTIYWREHWPGICFQLHFIAMMNVCKLNRQILIHIKPLRQNFAMTKIHF